MPEIYPPVFTISLDFELHWGRFDKTNIRGNEAYYLGARKAIPEILQVFKEYQIEATWAAVGMLFAKDVQEWENFSPVDKPSYKHQRFSAYHWLKTSPIAVEHIFAPDLIEKILQAVGQELGSHTFSHYYTLADGQTANQFREDLQAVQHIAQENYGVTLNSLVFPRNQLNIKYLEICKEEGFAVIRSNPKNWYWKDTSQENLIKKIFRTGDAIIPTGKKSSYTIPSIEVKNNSPLMLPASRFFRPYHPQRALLNRWKIQRICNEMTYAAQQKEVYHLWWHPHNFGLYTRESILELKEVLNHFDKLRSQYDMVSLNMKNTSNLILSAKVNSLAKF